MRNQQTNATKGTNLARHVRVILTPDLYRRLRHVAVERDVALGTLLVEAAEAFADGHNR